jgi:predicted DNA-binding transcriptional regulator AlpA
MKLAEVLDMTGVGKKTIYRWMDNHPTLKAVDPNSLLGHPFPKPTNRDGRFVVWDGDEVRLWWSANARTIGRHPEEGTMITMTWERFRSAMLKPPEIEDVNGEAVVEDHMRRVRRYEADGDNVRVWLHDANDAVLFKLTYA